MPQGRMLVKHTPLWHGLPPLTMEQAYTLVAWITSSYDGTSIHPCGMDYLFLRWNKHTPLWHGLPKGVCLFHLKRR
jgi:hypothetical protein